MKTPNFLKGLGFLFLLTIIISCSDNGDTNNKNLIGTWSWVSSSGGIAGTTETPASTGKNRDLKFTSDGKYFYFTNGVLSSQGTYNIEIKKSNLYQTNKNAIIFSKDGYMIIEKIDDSNLFLSDDNFDGFGSSYIRK
jgi:hypothetical protein